MRIPIWLFVFLLLLCIGIGYALALYAPVVSYLYAPHKEQSAAKQPVSASSSANAAAAPSAGSAQVPASAGVNVGSKLTDAQRTMLKNMGIDPDTLVITPTMAACAEGKLGVARMAEIQNGATPSFVEGTELLACYKQ